MMGDDKRNGKCDPSPLQTEKKGPDDLCIDDGNGQSSIP